MKKYKILFAISLIAIGLMSALLASINEKQKRKTTSCNSQMDRWKQKRRVLENTIKDKLILGNKQKF